MRARSATIFPTTYLTYTTARSTGRGESCRATETPLSQHPYPARLPARTVYPHPLSFPPRETFSPFLPTHSPHFRRPRRVITLSLSLLLSLSFRVTPVLPSLARAVVSCILVDWLFAITYFKVLRSHRISRSSEVSGDFR